MATHGDNCRVKGSEKDGEWYLMVDNKEIHGQMHAS